MRKILLLIIVCTLIPAYGYGRSGKSYKKGHIKKRLIIVKKHIREKKKKLRLSQKKASETLNKIDTIDRQNSLIESKIAALNAQKIQLISKTNNTQKKILSLSNSIRVKKNVVSKLLVASFKLSQVGYLQIILASDSSVDLEKRYKLMSYVLTYNERAITDYLSEKETLKKEQNNYIAQKSQLDVLTNSLNKQKLDLLKTKKQRIKMLAEIRRSTEMTKRILLELRKSAKKLKNALKSLEESSGKKNGFAGMRGRLPLPVKGKIENIFGKNTGSMIDAKGILFVVASNASIKAVYSGRIVWSQWLKGYGNTVIIDHGNRYFTVYAHVGDTDITVGNRVKAGEVIGKVGEAGLNAGRTLYFEIRHGQSALNPNRWLRIK